MNSAPLPPDVIAGMTWGPFGYRRYPVFSRPWLLWRTVFATLAICLYGMLALVGHVAAGDGWARALMGTGYFVAGGVLMVTAGPALAAWVRSRGWNERIEARAVIVSVVLGFAGAGAADWWASRGIESSLQGVQVPVAERKVSDLDEAKIRLFDILGGFLYFAVGGGLAALAYFSERRRMRARAEHLARLDSDMRLAVLQAQIEPHFLFNALASIRPLIGQDAARAEAALDALAEHLRATIPQMREQSRAWVSTLGQQVDICASYLTVMQVRMGARLQVEFEVAEELKALAFPPLMLLSLVENAIKHGIEPKPGPGTVKVAARATSTELTVSVRDDGAGLKQGLSSGLGLANVRAQLEVRHGSKARLTVAAQPEGGTVAEIVVPQTLPSE